MILLFVLLNVAGCLLYRRHLKKPIAQEKLIDACIIAGVTLLAMSPMFSTYLYNGDDLCYHLARMEGSKTAYWMVRYRQSCCRTLCRGTVI